MKLRSVLDAAFLFQCLMCAGWGYAQSPAGPGGPNDSLRAKPEMTAGQATSAASAAGESTTHSTGQPTVWIHPELPKPDSEGWMHLFDGKGLYGCTPEGADVQAGRVLLEGRWLHVESAILHFDVEGKDVEVRARLKKVSGQTLKLTVRNTTTESLWRGCATFFDGGKHFTAGKNDGTGWKDLGAATSRKRYDDFFDLEVAAVGDRLTVKADGEEILSTAGSSVDYGGVRFAAQGGTILFERIELRLLDKDANPWERFVGAVLTNFPHWDKNGDGALQEPEITRAVQDPEIKGDAAAAAAALKRMVTSESDKHHKVPPLTSRFFQTHDPLLGRCVSEFRGSRTRLKDAAGLPLFARDSPTLSECRQRGLGDCYLVAVLGAAIESNPGAIRGMITANAQAGGYQVGFLDGTRVDVPDLTEGELAWMGPGTAPCLWQRLLEKAWGLRKICRSRGTADPTLDPFDVVSGGSGENMLLSLTGHETVDYYLGVSGHEVTRLDTLRVAVTKTLQSHRLAEAFVWNASGSYFLPNHAYAILGYDADSDSVRLWNPLGSDFAPSGSPGPRAGYKTVGGQFTMPLRELPAAFAHVRVETDQPAVVAGPKVFP